MARPVTMQYRLHRTPPGAHSNRSGQSSEKQNRNPDRVTHAPGTRPDPDRNPLPEIRISHMHRHRMKQTIHPTGITMAGSVMRNLLRRHLLPAALFLMACSAHAAEDFDSWVEDFRSRAVARGVSPEIFDRAFEGVRYNPKVIEADLYQPEFTRPIWEYLDRAVSKERIKNGRAALAAHRGNLARITEIYGVPPEILIAIWGIESAYGASFGTFNAIEALSTLGYNGRRPEFGEQELLAALTILRQEGLDPRTMISSWAGAMGHTQFIPTSYLYYAVDFNGDQKRDLWAEDPSDALASAANYLARNGWHPTDPWGIEVHLPEGFNYRLAVPGIRRPPATWREQGVTLTDGSPLPDWSDRAKGSILAPAGEGGPIFLVLGNFRALLAYNNATSYALAVSHLADRIRDKGEIHSPWPRGDRPLRGEEIRDLQRMLSEIGFDSNGVDGILGPNTRDAVRDFQESEGRIPDGYVSAELIESVRRAFRARQ